MFAHVTTPKLYTQVVCRVRSFKIARQFSCTWFLFRKQEKEGSVACLEKKLNF